MPSSQRPWLLALALAPSLAADAPPTIDLRDGVAIANIARSGRSTVHVDPVEARVVRGERVAPKAGDELTMPDGSIRPWTAVKAGDDGALPGRAFSGGYAYVAVESEADRVMILEASGHGMVYVNGEPRAGDPYGYGSVHLPVALRRGTNDFLFASGRGGVRARLVAPKAPAFLDLADATWPDLGAGKSTKAPAGVVVVNAANAPLRGAIVEATIGGKATRSPVPIIPAMTSRKVPVSIEADAPAAGPVALTLRLLPGEGTDPIDSAEAKLDAPPAGATLKRTFLSGIDGSVQYFGLVPPLADPASPGKPGLVLSLHGASVEGIGQARAYAAKPGLAIVAPTNRRPYGFDWEDWGRLDAMEVLDLATRELDADPARIYLTGHSMGGHGTWHLGVTFPDRFAAVAPSAGWISMMSYAGVRRNATPSAIEEVLQRSASASDTLALVENLSPRGVYVLHGDADDNVPVAQAREMRKVLGGFHPDFAYFEQAGAGHWWGNECVDWPPLFAFLGRHRLPESKDVRRIVFRTAGPGVSARSGWATIEAQLTGMRPSEIRLANDPEKRRISGATVNVLRLSLDLSALPPGPVSAEIDGATVADLARPEDGGRAWLSRDGDAWKVTAPPSPDLKSPARSGPFKDAFRNRMAFVVGTKGTPEETAWAFAKARYDAETFAYRGNGAVDVVPDTEVPADPDRNLILYGNADTHAAWDALIGPGPVQVRRGSLRVGDREATGDDLACLFVRPRPGSATASVGVVSGTGLSGMRLADRVPYFVSGVGLPDLIVLGPDALTSGVAGIRAAGFFGPDWGVPTGEIVWKE